MKQTLSLTRQHKETSSELRKQLCVHIKRTQDVLGDVMATFSKQKARKSPKKYPGRKAAAYRGEGDGEPQELSAILNADKIGAHVCTDGVGLQT